MAEPVRFVRNSEGSVWRECRLKWYLTFQQGFLSNRVNRHFWLGTLVHHCLSEYHLGHTTSPAHLFSELGAASIDELSVEAISTTGADLDYDNVEELRDYLEMGTIMLEGYEDWDKAERDFDVIESELAYYLPMIDNDGRHFTFVCRFDLLAENSDGIWVPDFKTAADFRDEKRIDQDQQFRRYPWVVTQAHPEWADEVAGSMWIALRKVKQSKQAKPPFYKKLSIELTPDEIKEVGRELLAEVTTMLEVEERLAMGDDPRLMIYPSPSFDCTFRCDYYSNGLCQVWRRGMDATKFGSNYGTWGNDPYSEYREDWDGSIPIGRRVE